MEWTNNNQKREEQKKRVLKVSTFLVEKKF